MAKETEPRAENTMEVTLDELKETSSQAPPGPSTSTVPPGLQVPKPPTLKPRAPQSAESSVELESTNGRTSVDDDDLSGLLGELEEEVTENAPAPIPLTDPRVQREQQRPPTSLPPPPPASRRPLSGHRTLSAPATKAPSASKAPPHPTKSGGSKPLSKKATSAPPPIPNAKAKSTSSAAAPRRPPTPARTERVPAGTAQRQKEHESLLRSYQALAERWENELRGEGCERARATRLHYELGRLFEGPLDDLKKALDHFQSAVDQTPGHLASLRAARRTAISLRKHPIALKLFDAEARITADSRRKAALIYAKGRLLEDGTGDVKAAREAYVTAAELDRANPSILKAIEQTDLSAKDWNRLQQTIERAANTVGADPRHRAALVVERARILEHREDRVDEAIELYETALRLDAYASGALDSLERLHEDQRRWRDLIRVLSLRAEQSADPVARALAWYRIGKLHSERLGNRQEGVLALERAAQETPRDLLILEELATQYERSELYEQLASVLLRIAETTAERSARLSIFYRIGQLLDERLGQTEDSRKAYEQALALDPTHIPTLRALGQIYEANKLWESLTAMHLAEAEEANDPERRASAHMRVAEILEKRLERPNEAIAQHSRALSVLPSYAPSFKALARLYAQFKRHHELIELYERACEGATETDMRIAYLFKIGALYEDALEEPAQAAHAYRRILEHDESNLGAIHALQRATEAAGRYEELVEALGAEAKLTQDDGRLTSILTRAAEILDERLNRQDDAISRYRHVLELSPTYGPALGGLGRVYQRAGRWEDLLELHQRELENAESDASAAALLHKMGLLYEERIGIEERAIEAYRRALERDATHQASLKALVNRLASRREWAEVVEVLQLELSGLADPPARARAAYRLGEVFEQHLEEPERAASSYEAALTAVPGFAPAENALWRIREHQGAWRRLVDELERRAASEEDPALAANSQRRAGEIWARELNDLRRAADCYERALTLHPGHLDSLLSLEVLYRQLARPSALASVYGRLARALADAPARVAVLRELGRITGQQSDPSHDDLRQIYEAVLSLSPDDPGALEALETLALQTGDRRLLANVDSRLIANAGDQTAAAAYQTRLAESLELAGDANAVEAYRAALASDPENIAAARGLTRVAQQLGDPIAIVEAARREAALERDPAAAAAIWVRAGHTAHHKLEDTRAALADYERALEIWPDNRDAAAGLTELLVHIGQPARAADRLSRAASSARDEARVAELWMEVARIQAELLDNAAGAVTSLTRVLKEMPKHVPTLRRMAELHMRQSRWIDAAEILAQVVSLAPNHDVLKDAHLRLAEIWDERAPDPARALVSLQAVLALDANHPEALRRLAHLSARGGDLNKAVQVLTKLARTGTNRAEALCELSEVHAQRGDGRASREAALQALALSGPNSPAARRHKQLVREPKDWQEHVDALRKWLNDTKPGPQEARTALVEVSRILSDELRRPREAADALRTITTADPKDLDARRRMITTLRQSGQFDEALDEARALLAERPAHADLWRDMAATLHGTGDTDRARRALAPLKLLDNTTPREEQEIDRVRARPAQAHPGSLGRNILEALYPVRQSGTLVEMLRLIVQGLGKIYPPDFESYGLAARDRITSRSDEPIRMLANSIASMFGVADVNLYVHRHRGRGVAVELTDPPSILLPAVVPELGLAQQAFALARPMANIALGLHGLDKLTPRELEIVVAAAGRRAAATFGRGLTSEEILEDISKRLYRALPRRTRKMLDETAPRYVSEEAVDFARFVEASQTSANRVAMVVADDLLASVDLLQRTERDLAELRGADLVGHPVIRRMLRFWISPEAHVLRKRAGMADVTGPTGRTEP